MTIAVFWDPVWLAKKTAMITALGARYSNNPSVKIVGASFANANNEDWAVPTSTRGGQRMVHGWLDLCQNA